MSPEIDRPMGPQKQAVSPFDRLRRVDPQGLEYWLAREVMPYMGCNRWERFVTAILRAQASLRNSGELNPSDFHHSWESYSTKPCQDVRLSRNACYTLAMNGDPNLPEVALAQAYFRRMTQKAEAASTPYHLLPWSVRLGKTTGPHCCYMSAHCPGYFSVVSALAVQILIMEEELARHLLPLNPGDLPDGSIGRHWARYRRSLGRPPSTLRAPLLLPDRDFTAMVLIDPVAELGDVLAWRSTSDLPVHLPNSEKNTPGFRPAARGWCPPWAASHAPVGGRARPRGDLDGGQWAGPRTSRSPRPGARPPWRFTSTTRLPHRTGRQALLKTV
jgi:hypothetical protein